MWPGRRATRPSAVSRRAARSSAPLHVRSFAKINLALSVLGLRADGFHEIRTVFQSIDLCDELEFRPSDEIGVLCAGPGATEIDDNLVSKAASALAGFVSAPRGVEIVLRKRIPVGAGLGGGSSNAAATLLGLNRFWKLNVPHEDLRRLAAGLGSDVPFFLQGGTALGIGRGEEIYPLPELPASSLVVIYPGVAVRTEEAYSRLSLRLTSDGAANRIQSLSGRIQEGWKDLAEIFNDFETSILPAYPAIREAKDFLVLKGAVAALLSGSGSSVFGFFLDEESALSAARTPVRESWRVFPAKTLSRAEYFQRMFG